MTNLIGDQRLGWFTRARLLVGLPLVGCGLVAVAVVLAFVRPTTERIGALNQQLDDLQGDGRRAGQSASRAAGWMGGWPGGRLGGRPGSWLACRPAGWPAGQSAGWSIGRPDV